MTEAGAPSRDKPPLAAKLDLRKSCCAHKTLQGSLPLSSKEAARVTDFQERHTYASVTCRIHASGEVAVYHVLDTNGRIKHTG